MREILTELCETVPQALIRASESASSLFSHQVGEAITQGTNQCLEKMKRQLNTL